MEIVLSIMVLVAIALVLGAAALWRRGGARKPAVLMVVLAAIMVANVAIWAVPNDDGANLLDSAEQ